MKYLRIKQERIRKYAELIGGLSIPLAILLFAYLQNIGAITILDYNWSPICAGTEEDFCWATITFKANTDIYVYPSENNSWLFSTDKKLKLLRIERKWGDGWREIKLNESCNGRWCGCYWCDKNHKAKYSYVFRKGRTYVVRFVGYKYNPYDDVKWSFSDKIDPLWKGVKQETFYINDSNNVTIKVYRISFDGVTLETPAFTRCSWNISKEMRDCKQEVKIIYNKPNKITLSKNLFKYKFVKNKMRNMKIKHPAEIKKGNYTIIYEFEYPPNEGEEWDLGIKLGDYEWKIDPEISGCSDITSSGTYYLTANITNSSTSMCINIEANNVILDCQGNIVDGDDTAYYGIYVYRDPVETTNITIKNCIVTDWNYANICFDHAHGNSVENVTSNSSPGDGILLYISSWNNLSNITTNSNGYNGFDIYYFSSSNAFSDVIANYNGYEGFYFFNAHANTLSNITANYNTHYGIAFDFSNSNNLSKLMLYSNGDNGILLSDNSDNNTIANSTISNNTNAGIYIGTDSNGNKIYNCLLNNSVNVKITNDTSGENYFNTTKQLGTRIYSNGNYIGGNYYTNSTGNGYSDACNDTNADGFCDDPLNLSNGTSVAYDYLPLSDEYSEEETTFSITLNSPPNQTTTDDSTPDFNFTVSGTESSYSCELFINDTGYGTATANNNTATIITANSSLSDGTYDWYVNCTAGGVTNQSEVREITINTATITVKLQDPDTENTDDVGIGTSLAGAQYFLIKFNLSSLPSNIEITEALLYLYAFGSDTSKQDFDVYYYGIDNQTWHEEDNVTALWNLRSQRINQTYVTNKWNVSSGSKWDFIDVTNTTKYLFEIKNYDYVSYWIEDPDYNTDTPDTSYPSNSDVYLYGRNVVGYNIRTYTKENTDFRPYLNITYVITEQPDINYGLNSGITFRFPCNLNTGTTYGQPEGQNSTLASIWCKNNGTGTGNFQARLNQSLPSGWWLFIANSSTSTKIQLTTSWQTFYWSVASGTNVSNCAWFWNNCSAGAGSPHPNVEIEFRAVS